MIGKKNTPVFFLVLCCILTVLVVFADPAGATNSATVAISGSIPRVIYNISVSGIDTGNATITWNTNFFGNSTVLYGTTTGYGSVSTDGVMTEDHVLSLHSLSPATTYHYQVVSIDLAGNRAAGTDATFNTTALSQGTVANTTTVSTTFAGTTVQTVNGVQQVSLNLTSLAGTPQVSGNTVTLQNPATGWSQVQYVSSGITTQDGNITLGQIQSVSMQSAPVTASLGGSIGTVSTQVQIGLTQLVPDVTLQQSIIQGATASATNAFQVAAANNNLNVQAVAYTVEFQNAASLDASLNSAGVKMNLSLDDAWVAANANGDVNNIRVIRFGDDGTKEVLSTTFVGRQGTTDTFEVVSPHGISLFGIAAVTAVTSSGGGTSSSGGGQSPSGGGGGAGGLFVAAVPAAPPAVPQGQPQQMGPSENAATTTQSLTFAGLSASTGPSGIQTFTFNTTLAAQSGVSATLGNTSLSLNQPGLAMVIVTNGSPSVENSVISGTVQSVSITTAPSPASLSFGNVSAAVNASLASIPQNAAITTTISEVVTSDVASALRQAAENDGRQLNSIACVVTITKTNFAATGPATVSLAISPGWVGNHGGIESISIGRIGDDQSADMLDTSYQGTDAQGLLVFAGNSPHGLSQFGLVSVGSPGTAGQEPETGLPHPPESVSGIIGEILLKNRIILAIAAVCLIAGGALITLVWRYRQQKW
ncbi:hypothetical protein Mboo_0960 [Methanoregula boonei 6A8]|uniref:Fibronectin, type III domain protein n=1 Tax=Methanoregula boonei (strain DSM 21154 / JCM 14090 / 6A8) TaxID=456442 RepID=A7I6W7_METB6|nr:fibronectin type III domain-containing protein [Methanoregula boonei]ABS55478.1 hypothetical protein Mboo_0960 [Methanoregula boonei 6A8]